MFKRDTQRSIYGFYDLDAIDQNIIQYLQKNGRESFTKIADEIGVPASTVRDRTNRMVDSGVLQIVARINARQSPQQMKAMIGIKLIGGNHREVAKKIAAIDEVSHLAICAGSFDLLAELICKDQSHLLDVCAILQDLSEVQHIETFVYFTVVKEGINREG